MSYAHCGDNDLRARINYQDGTALSIYSEGAALCQPYNLHFVESDATGKTLYEFTRAINRESSSRRFLPGPPANPWQRCGTDA